MIVPAVHPDPVPVRDGYVEVAGTRTRYRVWGDPAAARTIVAVHGFRGDHHGLLPLAARLPTAKVITPDLPGFGGSAEFCHGRHDVAGYAGWLADFCARLADDRPYVLLGHSFGAVLCAAAVAAGLRPQALVLINPIAAPALQGRRAVLSRLAVSCHRLAARLPEPVGRWLLTNRMVVRVMSQMLTVTSDRRLRRWIHDQHRRYFSGFADRRVVLESFEASVSHDISEYADRITVPTLLIAGDRDDIVPIRAVQRLNVQLPDSRLLVLAEVGHLIHYERPAAAAAAITDFLDRLS